MADIKLFKYNNSVCELKSSSVVLEKEFYKGCKFNRAFENR